MKKCLIALSLLALMTALGGMFIQAEDLKSDECAVFHRDGEKTVGVFEDILVAAEKWALKDGRKIPLGEIWMVNFVDTQWNFPKEREKMDSAEHYLFHRNGDVTAGTVVDFSDHRRAFEMKTGEYIPIGQIKRIYFKKQLPERFADILAKIKVKKEIQEGTNIPGIYQSGLPGPAVKKVTLVLNADKTTAMTVDYAIDAGKVKKMWQMVKKGTWKLGEKGNVHVTFTEQTTMTGVSQNYSEYILFKPENNILTALQFTQTIYGTTELILTKVVN